LPPSQNPEQQSSALAQVTPAVLQVEAAQVPDLQLKPSQHPSSLVQLAPASPQSHTPLVQVSREQQSRSAAQALPRSEQVQTPAPQCSPLQHSASLLHVNWEPAQRAQLPPRHW